MRATALGLGLVLCLAVAPASALTVLTNGYCANAGPGDFGIADQIDGTGGGAVGGGSAAPYNVDMDDDAIVCADSHVVTLGVNTAAEFINEISNTIAHELGHLLGLEHADGTAASLMDGDYDGLDKGFTTAAEQAVLDDASQDTVQVVWLDFDALQPGLLALYQPFSQSSALTAFGIGAGQVAATIASIVGLVESDYAGPWDGGATYEFYLQEIDALNATSGVGNYSTVSIVSVPEPGAALLVALGLAALSLPGWQRRRD